MRTGPFIPPIRLPYNLVIVSEAFRQKLEQSGLRGLTFRLVMKKHIVCLHWELWDRTAAMPAHLPIGGEGIEPEDYVLGQPHSESAAEAMGNVWEATPVVEIETRVYCERRPWDYDLCVIDNGRLEESDFFKPARHGVYVSSRAQEWIRQHAGEWVRFKPTQVCGEPR